MFKLALNASSKPAAKLEIDVQMAKPENQDAMMTPQLRAAIEALLDALPASNPGGSVIVSLRGNVPLGAPGDAPDGANFMLEVAFHSANLTAAG